MKMDDLLTVCILIRARGEGKKSGPDPVLSYPYILPSFDPDYVDGKLVMEKAMAPHSSTLAWMLLRTFLLGRLIYPSILEAITALYMLTYFFPLMKDEVLD